MNKKKKSEGSGKIPTPDWMTTWSDMVTLLFCFFVLLYALSDVNAEKFAEFATGISGRTVFAKGESVLPGNTGVLPNNPTISSGTTDPEASDEDDDEDGELTAEAVRRKEETEAMASTFKTYLAQNELTKFIEISVEQLGEYMRISFPEGLLFASGQAVLSESARNVLDVVSEVIAEELEKFPNSRLRIEGHTDNVPINTALYPSNRYLSSARAIVVLEYLEQVKGFDPKRLSSEGMGEHQPVDTNDTAEGRAKNRRVEILVYVNQVNASGDNPANLLNP